TPTQSPMWPSDSYYMKILVLDTLAIIRARVATGIVGKRAFVLRAFQILDLDAVTLEQLAQVLAAHAVGLVGDETGLFEAVAVEVAGVRLLEGRDHLVDLAVHGRARHVHL